MFYELAHTGFRHTTSTKNLNSVASSVLCASCAIALQECNLAANKQSVSHATKEGSAAHIPSKFVSLVFVVHMSHLVSYVLEPRLQALRTCYHRCQLATDDSELM
jgi:hypothetical protein